MTGHPNVPRSASLEERLAFYSEPYVKGRCQLWLGAKDRGYGVLNWRGRVTRVTRLVWECERGPIPNGLGVLHVCDKPPCRNIDHLFLGTDADNHADMVAKDRHLRGERAPAAKLTEAEVLEIRAIPDDVPQTVIAAMYGIKRPAVSKIKLGQRWTHL